MAIVIINCISLVCCNFSIVSSVDFHSPTAMSNLAIVLLIVMTGCIDSIMLFSSLPTALSSPAAAAARGVHLPRDFDNNSNTRRSSESINRFVNYPQSTVVDDDNEDNVPEVSTSVRNRKPFTIPRVGSRWIISHDGVTRSKETSDDAVGNKMPVKRNTGQFCCVGDIFCVFGSCRTD